MLNDFFESLGDVIAALVQQPVVGWSRRTEQEVNGEEGIEMGDNEKAIMDRDGICLIRNWMR